jgi:hypothetical protein
MKLKTIFEDMTQQRTDVAEMVARALQQAGWSEGVNERPVGATFYRGRGQNGATEFRVPVVNSIQGNGEQGQVTSAHFNQTIDQLYRQARQTGTQFTQPVGMQGTAFENDRARGTTMQFFVGGNTN